MYETGRGALAQGDAAPLSARLLELQQLKGWRRVSLIDEKGEPLWSSADPGSVPSADQHEAIRRAALHNEVVVSGPSIDARDQVELSIATPLAVAYADRHPVLLIEFDLSAAVAPALARSAEARADLQAALAVPAQGRWATFGITDAKDDGGVRLVSRPALAAALPERPDDATPVSGVDEWQNRYTALLQPVGRHRMVGDAAVGRPGRCGGHRARPGVDRAGRAAGAGHHRCAVPSTPARRAAGTRHPGRKRAARNDAAPCRRQRRRQQRRTLDHAGRAARLRRAARAAAPRRWQQLRPLHDRTRRQRRARRRRRTGPQRTAAGTGAARRRTRPVGLARAQRTHLDQCALGRDAGLPRRRGGAEHGFVDRADPPRRLGRRAGRTAGASRWTHAGLPLRAPAAPP